MGTIKKVECTNCGELLKVSERDTEGQDIIYITCSCCDCENEIEVEYDEDNEVVDLHTY